MKVESIFGGGARTCAEIIVQPRWNISWTISKKCINTFKRCFQVGMEAPEVILAAVAKAICIDYFCCVVMILFCLLGSVLFLCLPFVLVAWSGLYDQLARHPANSTILASRFGCLGACRSVRFGRYSRCTVVLSNSATSKNY